MLEDVIRATREVGLELHNGKTKILRKDGCLEHNTAFLEVAGHKIEILSKHGSTMYLGRLLATDSMHDVELDFRLEGKGLEQFFCTKSAALYYLNRWLLLQFCMVAAPGP